jgi:hypothetical protein
LVGTSRPDAPRRQSKYLREYQASTHAANRNERDTTGKGPAIFLAQFAGDAPPFNKLDGLCAWAASLG